jgi:hypothetical protein
MRPNTEQQRVYLSQTYFGVRGDNLDRFISRAYRDMNRTFRGLGKLSLDKRKNEKRAKQLLLSGKSQVRKYLSRLEGSVVPKPGRRKQGFDLWHNESCKSLIGYYAKMLQLWGVEARMTYGQAQKWLNMTIKYCWVCGGEELDWLGGYYEVAHFVVDEVILVAAVEEGVVDERPCKNWSKWNSAEEYRSFQMVLRQAAKNRHKSPLELEFEWWGKYRPRVTGGSDE